MEMGRNLEHTAERHQRGFKVPMEMGSLFRGRFGAAKVDLFHMCPIAFENCLIRVVWTTFGASRNDSNRYQGRSQGEATGAKASP